MSPAPVAPVWLLLLIQAVSVVGDSVGQRCARVVHKHSERRFMLGMCVISCLQMFVAAAIVQLAVPSVATPLTKEINGTNVDVCTLPVGDPNRPTGDAGCYAQGPLTIYRAIGYCPMTLLNGVANIVYYVAEAAMYQHSMAVLLLVAASLSSSFIISPMQKLFGIGNNDSKLPPVPIVLGIIGAILCTIERTPPPPALPAPEPLADGEAAIEAPLSGAPDAPGEVEAECALDPQTAGVSRLQRARVFILSTLRVLPAFGTLGLAYALYFVLMRYFDDHCNLNPWGYNALDQVLLPLYLVPALFGVDVLARFLPRCFGRSTGSDTSEPLTATVVASGDAGEVCDEHTELQAREVVTDGGALEAADGRHWVLITISELLSGNGAGALQVFIYRLLINARAIGYTYIAAQYDLTRSYLELTLIRVCLSWLASLGWVLVTPRFIRATESEKRRLRDWLNLTSKVIGTVAIVASLLVLNHS
jgi:hypothetical protein